jgi:hypothetical protein
MCDISIDRKFVWSRKTYTFGGQNGEKSHQSLKMENNTTILIWSIHSVFGLSWLIFTFLTPKNVNFPVPYKISDRLIYHTTILIF